MHQGREADAEENIAIALRYIEEGAYRMQALLRDIQLYLAANEPRGRVVQLDTEDVVHSVMKDLNEKIQQTGATIALGNLPPVTMDRQRLRDIFTILLKNALSFTNPQIPPSIIIAGEREGDILRFKVEDNGIGIPVQ